MKGVLIAIMLASSYDVDGQVEVKIEDGPLAQSVDWFISRTKKIIDSAASEPGSRISRELGVIQIILMNRDDKVIRQASSDGDTLVTRTSKYRFTIAMVQYNWLEHQVPSIYFFRNGIPVVVYTSFDKFWHFDEKNWRKIAKERFGKFRNFRSFQDLKEYTITIADLSKKDFVAREYR